MDFLLFDSPIGPVGLGGADGRLTRLYLPGGPLPRIASRATGLLLDGRDQILGYLAGRRRAFDLPLAPAGTAFQTQVWQALLEIPYGQTCTYADLARRIGNPKACRAVGMANNRNPLPILIPCHRVIGADGKLVGYAGGLALKQRLLDLERQIAPAPLA